VFERFTDGSRRALVFAQEEARLLDHNFIGTEHILLGLLKEGEGLAAGALRSLGISIEAVRERVEGTIGPAGSAPAGSPAFTRRARRVLEISLREALQLGHNYIGTEHILLGLVREGDGVAAQVLQSLGATLPTVHERVIQLLTQGEAHNPPPRLGATLEQREWPRYPMKLVAGPATHLGSDGVEFFVTGVLFFDESVQVFWQMSGIPEPIIHLMRDQKLFSSNLQPASSAAYVMLTDDLATTYEHINSSLEARQGGRCTGTSLFTPAVPESATRLSIAWQDEVIEIEV
jgi:Clp amino terminal domain, pathogenicity island component